MNWNSFLIFSFIQIFGTQALIIPDEIPTILSVIYSNIPVIKKGTDSRFGWGFRLGNRADIQVLTELGPQTYTQPLGNQPARGTSKRNALETLSNTLYAQRLKEKQEKTAENKIPETEGSRWLLAWSKSVRQQEVPSGAAPGLAVGEIDAKSVIPDDQTFKLIEMYRKKLKENLKRQEDLKKVVESESVTETSAVIEG